MKTSLTILLTLMLLSSVAYPDEKASQQLFIPAPEYLAEEDIERHETDGSTTLFFSWSGNDPKHILGFYNEYFTSKNWKDPVSDFVQDSRGWNSFDASINSNDQTLITYGKSWEQADEQAIAVLTVSITTDKSIDQGNTANLTITQVSANQSIPSKWDGNIELGLIKTSGNTDSENYKAGVALSRETSIWTQQYGLGYIKNSSNGVDFSESANARFTARRSLNNQSYMIASVSYQDDGFDGFTEQYSASLGYGYKLIDTEPVQWGVSAGLGYRSTSELKTFADGSEVKGKNLNGATLVVTSDFKNQLTSNTQLVDLFRAEIGLDNTYIENDAALIVSMNERYALKAGVLVRHNTDPGLGAKKTDTITNLSFLYHIGS